MWHENLFLVVSLCRSGTDPLDYQVILALASVS